MASQLRTSRRGAPAFSLVELVIVVVIMGIVAAIAIPRVSGAAAKSRASAMRGDLRVLIGAVDHYAAEHAGRSPAHEPNGSVMTDGELFVQRLVFQTDDLGVPKSGIFGPYLRAVPPNPVSGLDTIRIDGDPGGAKTHGWRFDSVLREFQADNSVEAAQIKPWDPQAGVGAVLEVK